MVADGDSGQDSGEEEKNEHPSADDGFDCTRYQDDKREETPPPYRSGEFDFPFEASGTAEVNHEELNSAQTQPARLGDTRGRERVYEECDHARD